MLIFSALLTLEPNWLMISMGSGNTIVVFFSTPISVKGLQVAELDGGGLGLENFGGVGEFLRCFELAFRVNNLGAALAFGFRLAGDGALHLLGNIHLLHFDFATLMPQGSVSWSRMICSLALTLSRCERISSSSNWPTTLRSVVCASCEVAY